MVPPRKTTETTEIETPGELMSHLRCRYSMAYDISKTNAPKISAPGKGTERVKIMFLQVPKGMYEPSFRYFSMYFAHISAVKNFSALTSFGST